MEQKDIDYWKALTATALTAQSPARLRSLVVASGAVNPAGSGNSKTALPGTYRPVGDTCPQACPLLNQGCYAQQGNTALHARRASALSAPSLRSALLAMVEAARGGTVARLHVSGDFLGPDGELDTEYVDGLIVIAKVLGERFPRTKVLAFTYTHVTGIDDTIEALRNVGIVVRRSGRPEPWGAVVLPKSANYPAAARAVGATYCPAQAAKDVGQYVTCQDCTLCWTRDRLVAFRPDGNSNPPADMGA